MLWLLHPIQLLPVLHVVQRMTSLSALFLLAALQLHICGRERGGCAGGVWVALAWAVLWPLSFFSKETGVLFPAFALAWELIIRRWASVRLDRFARSLFGLGALTLLAGLAYGLSPTAQWLWAGYDLRAFSLVERLMTEARVVWFYLGLIVLPRIEALGLYHDDIVVSTSLFSPWTTLPALLGLAGLLGLAWSVRTRAPLLAFGIVWFLIGHSLESTVLPLELAHEHRNYIPLFGIVLAGAWALLYSLENTGPRKTVGIALAGTALVYFSMVTALRAHQFGDEVRRTQLEAQHHQRSARAQHQAGVALAALPAAALPASPIYAFARRHYEIAGELDPDFKMSWLGLIHLGCSAGVPVKQVEVAELGRRLRERPFAPGDRSVLYNLKEMSVAGTLCLSRPDIEGLFAAALTNASVSAGVKAILYSWYADYLWLHARDLAAARGALQHSLALNPENSSNRLKSAQLMVISGEPKPARQMLLDLRNEKLSAEEQKTLDELLAAFNIARH